MPLPSPITAESHALSHGGARYFGLFEVRVAGGDRERDYSWIVGIRNSHDKVYPLGWWQAPGCSCATTCLHWRGQDSVQTHAVRRQGSATPHGQRRSVNWATGSISGPSDRGLSCQVAERSPSS